MRCVAGTLVCSSEVFVAHSPGNHCKHMMHRRGLLLLQLPLLLQLAIALKSIALAGAFISPPFARRHCGENAKGLAIVACSSEAAPAVSTSLSEPSPALLYEYGFWAPASKNVPFGGYARNPFRVRGWPLASFRRQHWVGNVYSMM